MNRILLLFLVTFLSFSMYAEDINHRMVINFKSGEQVYFIVKEKPEITYIGSNICVKSTKNSIEYLRSDIKDFHFEEITTNVETIEYIGDGMITIFDMSGHIVDSVNGNFTNVSKILLDSFKPGLYIIKLANQQTIKYLKK